MACSCAGHLCLLVAFLLAGTAGASRVDRGASTAVRKGRAHIVPTLSPKSDSHFFGHDYPHDVSPTAPLEKDFNHPYPVVQDTDTYDKDFVKDENSDNGEWKAQQDYDRLRTRLQQLKAEADRAFAAKTKLEKQLAEEQAKEKAIQKQKKTLEESQKKAEEAADADMKAAKEAYEENMGSGAGSGANQTAKDNSTVSVGVTNATDKVKKEVEDIEDCKRKLAEAQARLKKLQAELLEAEAAEKAAKSAKATAEKTEAALDKKEAEAEAERDEEEAKAAGARASYETQRKELEEMEADMAKAEAKLRKFRSQSVDQDGGVTETKKSSALLHTPSLLMALATMAGTWIAL